MAKDATKYAMSEAPAAAMAGLEEDWQELSEKAAAGISFVLFRIGP